MNKKLYGWPMIDGSGRELKMGLRLLFGTIIQKLIVPYSRKFSYGANFGVFHMGTQHMKIKNYENVEIFLTLKQCVNLNLTMRGTG